MDVQKCHETYQIVAWTHCHQIDAGSNLSSQLQSPVLQIFVGQFPSVIIIHMRKIELYIRRHKMNRQLRNPIQNENLPWQHPSHHCQLQNLKVQLNLERQTQSVQEKKCLVRHLKQTILRTWKNVFILQAIDWPCWFLGAHRPLEQAY